jgi:hypothetical protein
VRQVVVRAERLGWFGRGVAAAQRQCGGQGHEGDGGDAVTVGGIEQAHLGDGDARDDGGDAQPGVGGDVDGGDHLGPVGGGGQARQRAQGAGEGMRVTEDADEGGAGGADVGMC